MTEIQPELAEEKGNLQACLVVLEDDWGSSQIQSSNWKNQDWRAWNCLSRHDFFLFIDWVPMYPWQVGKMVTSSSKFIFSELSNCSKSCFLWLHKSHPSSVMFMGMKVSDWLSLGHVSLGGRKIEKCAVLALLSNKHNCLWSRERKLEAYRGRKWNMFKRV